MMTDVIVIRNRIQHPLMINMKTEKAEPSKVLNNSTDEAASTESDGNDQELKPNEKRKKRSIPKAITNVLESILPNKAGKKKQQQLSRNTKNDNEKVASQSLKVVTTKAPTKDGTTPATTTKTTGKSKYVKKPPMKQSAAKIHGAPTEERKKALIGNLKPSNEHKICTSNARKTVKYLHDKVQQKQHIEEEIKLPAVGEKLSTKSGHVYTILKLIGRGCFGSVFLVANENGDKFAMKCSLIAGAVGLKNECKILLKASTINSTYFCKYVDSGKKRSSDDGKFACIFIIVELADKDVGTLMDEKKTISIATAVTIAQQTLLGLKDLHQLGYLHRDIKIENIMVSAGIDYQKIQLIDFGLSGKLPKFEDQHLADPPPSVKYLIGNLKTASLAALKNQKQCRKDDLESWVYAMVELFGTQLPWNDQTSQCVVIQMKERLRLKGELQQKFFHLLPSGMLTIYEYIIALEYCEIPDYDLIYNILGIIVKVSKVPKHFKVDFDDAKPYVEQPHSIEYEPKVKEAPPYYQLSNKKKHFNAVINGQSHNYNAKINGKNDEYVFICPNKDEYGKKCNRRIIVKDYIENQTLNGDFVQIKTIQNKHTCIAYKYKSKLENEKNKQPEGEDETGACYNPTKLFE